MFINLAKITFTFKVTVLRSKVTPRSGHDFTQEDPLRRNINLVWTSPTLELQRCGSEKFGIYVYIQGNTIKGQTSVWYYYQI